MRLFGRMVVNDGDSLSYWGFECCTGISQQQCLGKLPAPVNNWKHILKKCVKPVNKYIKFK